VDEFVAGRLAARRAIESLIGVPAPVSIEREPGGAPRIVGVDVELSVSITHGRAHAVAVVAEGRAPLGVDLTDTRDAARIRRVAERAFPRENEREMALADDRAARLAWATKEAIGKALRIGLLYDAGFARIALLSLAPIVARVDASDPGLRFEAEEREEGVLVVAVG